MPFQIYSCDVEDDFVDEIHLSSSQLHHFAREAQALGDFQLAVQYYQEVRKVSTLNRLSTHQGIKVQVLFLTSQMI